MAKRAGSTVVEAAGSHAIYVSQPNAVAAIIEKAELAVELPLVDLGLLQEAARVAYCAVYRLPADKLDSLSEADKIALQMDGAKSVLKFRESPTVQLRTLTVSAGLTKTRSNCPVNGLVRGRD